MTYIEALQKAIRDLHHIESKHIASVPVKETFEGKTIWEGLVEVFDLIGQPKAPKAYAWMHNTDDPRSPGRQVTVLHIPPITSPELAVKAALLEEYKNRGSGEKA
ncbi:MAG: hypothetical protein WA755_08975 [Candidatus Acidiferrales bacterium]